VRNAVPTGPQFCRPASCLFVHPRLFQKPFHKQLETFISEHLRMHQVVLQSGEVGLLQQLILDLMPSLPIEVGQEASHGSY
jgi:hypothetical protein